MAAAKCLSSIGLCAVRVTLLEDSGAPGDSYYVSDKTISLGFTPVISEGQDREVRNGCDCVTAANKAPDVLKRFTFALSQGAVEPGLLAMMLGQDPIYDPDDPTNVIGVNFDPDQLCGRPFVALEGWSRAEDYDHPDPDFPWIHYRWPSTQWQLGDNTLSADYMLPALTGFSRGNSEFGDPFSDLPLDGTLVVSSTMFTMWYESEDPPTAQCGLQTLA